MEISQQNTEQILRDITADLVGIINLDALKGEEVAIADEVREIMPGARSVILLAAEVFPEVIRFFTSSRTMGDIQLSDLANRNMEIVGGYLDWDAYKIIKRLHKLGYEGTPIPSDGAPFNRQDVSGVMPFGKLAEIAGMGTIGWHSMLLTPEFGARIRLSAVITSADLPPTERTEKYYPCPECGGACIKICPVVAIKQPGKDGGNTVDRFKCNNMIESSGGCSECLKVCPAGKGVFDDDG
jgi:epoxyqueuosine reductase